MALAKDDGLMTGGRALNRKQSQEENLLSGILQSIDCKYAKHYIDLPIRRHINNHTKRLPKIVLKQGGTKLRIHHKSREGIVESFESSRSQNVFSIIYNLVSQALLLKQ